MKQTPSDSTYPKRDAALVRLQFPKSRLSSRRLEMATLIIERLSHCQNTPGAQNICCTALTAVYDETISP